MNESKQPPNDQRSSSPELVALDRDHPGFRDNEYRRRRNIIAKLAIDHRAGDVVPIVEYTQAEHAVWQEVWRNLGPLLEQHACQSYLASLDRVALERDNIPQLREVNHRLEDFGGFTLSPVAGLVQAKEFLLCLEKRIFLATQYIRHPSTPLYTPEPDAIHELIGHAAFFADERMLRLNRAFGTACSNCHGEEAVLWLIRLYWYTIEFGLTRENNERKAYGAGILSSFGELQKAMAHEHVRPYSIDEIISTPFDPTDYQSVLFEVPSLEELEDSLLQWFDTLV